MNEAPGDTLGWDGMGEVKTMTPEPSGDWFEAIVLAQGPSAGVNNIDRDLFNKTFDAFMTGAFNDAHEGFAELAADGSSVSQYYLGMLFLNGKGVLQDFSSAHMWFNIASSRGHEKARKQLDKLTQSMIPEQVAQAQGMAREWVAQQTVKDV